MAEVSREQMRFAIYGQESSHGKADTSKENYAGARGPMQVIKPTFDGLKNKGLIPKHFDHSNPEHTMQAGNALVDHLFDKFGGDPSKVAAAYYAGEKAVRADGSIADFRDKKNPKAPTTLQYVSQVMGRLGNGGATVPVPVAQPKPTTVMSAWDQQMPGPMAPVAGAKAVDDKSQPANRTYAPARDATYVDEVAKLAGATAQAVAGADEVRDSDFLDKSRAAFMHNGVVGTVLKSLVTPDFMPEPGFSLDKSKFDGLSADEQAHLGQAGSAAEAEYIKYEIDSRREDLRQVNLSGAGVGIAATIFGGLPEGILTGMGIAKGLQVARMGSLALAAEGRMAAATGSTVLENVGGNVAFTAIQDKFDPYVGATDYALAAGMGLIGVAAATAGSFSVARSAEKAAQGLADTAGEHMMALRQQAAANLGTEADSRALVAEVQRLEANGIRETLNSGMGDLPANRRLIDEDPILRADEPVAVAKDMGLGKPDTPDAASGSAAPKYDNPLFLAQRVDSATNNPQWAKEIGTLVNNEMDYSTAAAMPKGTLHVTKAASERVQLTPALEAVRSLAPQFLGDSVVVVGHGTNNGRASGEIISAGNVHFIGLAGSDGPTGSIRTAMHEVGHAVFHQHARDIPADLLKRMKDDHSKFLSALRKGDLDEAANKRFGLTSTSREASAEGLTQASDKSYIESFDEYTAEQFVKYVESGKKDLGLTKQIIERITDAVGAALDFFRTAKRKGYIDPDESFAEFFDRVLDGNLKQAVKQESFLAPDLVFPSSFDQGLAYRGVRGKWSEAVRDDIEWWAPKGVDARTYAGADGQVVQTKMDLKNPRVIPEDAYNRDSLESAWTDSSVDGVIVTRDGEPIIFATFGKPAAEASSFNRSVDANDFANDPDAIKFGLNLLPLGTPQQQAEAKALLSLYKKAETGGYKVDPKRLSKLLETSVFHGAQSTANVMLRSNNPVARMVAAELLESASGAGGRRTSAAISKHLNYQAYLGNTLNDVQAQYTTWRNSQGVDIRDDFFGGKMWEQFNRLVAEEMESRRPGAGAVSSPPAVKQAADHLEEAYERMRVSQTSTKTIGWASLPPTSKGYMPHRMSPEKIRNMTNAQADALHSALQDQFVSIEGFDISFSNNLASKYLDRVRQRALGGFEAPAGIHQVGAADVVEEALEAMGMSREQVTAMMGKYMTSGAGHTKRRLQLDLNSTHTNADGSTFKLMDLFDTDQFRLIRTQAQRVSGEVALARHGIMGKAGLKLLRRAMEFGSDTQKVQPAELEAFDQVAAEFLGDKFGTQNKLVDRVMQVNSLARLGGMGFTQFAEGINAIFHVGAVRALDSVTSMPRLRKEIKALAKGEKVDNPIIGSLERFAGAEFGTESYKTVFPFDNQSLEYQTYGKETLSAADRLLRGGTFLQGKLSMWRTLHATQQRGMAEQIVRKAAQYLKDGGNDVALRDMGISDDLLARLRTELPNIAEFDGGRLTNLDITKAKDLQAAEEFTQAIHRGVSQIIQGTFIGETGKWSHDGLMRLMTQFRTFSLTSVEKQWARQVGNVGVAKTMGMMMGAMSLAAPIYMARTYLASLGRPDQEAYLEKQLQPDLIARATLNYIAMSGLAGDFLDAATAVSGMKSTGGRSGASSEFVGNVVAPAAGLVDDVWRGLQNTKEGTDPHELMKTLPFNRLPFIIPALNALGE